jgi:hypothetical protein
MADLEELQAEQIEQEASYALVPAGAGRGGYPEMPEAQMPRQLAAPPMGPRSHASPMSQLPGQGQWPQMNGGAPQAPYGPYYEARRPGESQTFDDGMGYLDAAGEQGNYAGYGGNPRGGNGQRPGGPPTGFDWDQR